MDPGLKRELNILQCPNCGGQLASESDNLTCKECGKVYPVFDEIPDFSASIDIKE